MGATLSDKVDDGLGDAVTVNTNVNCPLQVEKSEAKSETVPR